MCIRDRYEEPNNNSDMYTQIYFYDTQTKETKKVFQFNYTSQYPLGVYDAFDNIVYYTKRVNDETYKGDQIFKYNIEEDKEEQLTTDLFAVNYILNQGKGNLYVSAYSNEEMEYNLQNQKDIPGVMSFVMPRHTVYETDFNFSSTRELFSEEQDVYKRQNRSFAGHQCQYLTGAFA